MSGRITKTTLRPTRREALRRMGSLVLLLGVADRAHASPIVAVRVWPADDYTRVTIESDQAAAGPAPAGRQNPPRLVIDIEGLELDTALRELVGKVSSDDPFIAGVRVGQYTPRVVRLVVDLKQPVRPQQFSLDAGGRLQAPPGLRPVPHARRTTRCWR